LDQTADPLLNFSRHHTAIMTAVNVTKNLDVARDHEANDLLWSLVLLIGAERTQTQIHCAHSVALDLNGRQ